MGNASEGKGLIQIHEGPNGNPKRTDQNPKRTNLNRKTTNPNPKRIDPRYGPFALENSAVVNT